jgi:hypothetical protein
MLAKEGENCRNGVFDVIQRLRLFVGEFSSILVSPLVALVSTAGMLPNISI